MMRRDATSPVDEILAAIRQSKRYRQIDESVVRRSAADALVSSNGRLADAIKRTKRQLHQAYGAYVGVAPRYDRLLRRLREARAEGSDALHRELRAIMTLHASSAERVRDVDRFYEALFDRVGPVRSLIDLGCGLNPLAAPWMRLMPGAIYTAIDIDTALVEFAGECLALFGVEARPRVQDVVSHPPAEHADLALMLKMVPCLEQQRRGAAAAVIRALNARIVAVSFPTRSLGGRVKGMETHYARVFDEMVSREQWTAEAVEVPGELLYLITKDRPEPPRLAPDAGSAAGA